jgi:heterodisulfide reductase subunit B
MKYSYFPGCSLKGTGRAYEESLLAVLRVLDVKVQELDDWNCCGATAYMAVDESSAFTLASRNLAIAEKLDLDLMAPCAACYLVLLKTQYYQAKYPAIRAVVQRGLSAAGLNYAGEVRIRHPLDILVNDVGLDAIRAKLKEPLYGLKVAPYYGCQVVRPYSTFDHQDFPTTMDRLLAATGAEVVPFPLKTKCCGGSQTGTIPEVGSRLCHIIRQEAQRKGASLIATLCPLCQFNLDAYQDKRPGQWYEPIRMPVVYFTQLMGLAFGLSPKELGLSRNIIDAMPVLRSRRATAV